ncbi:hypothetical protein J3459_018583 [Metarhizium acridum]|nr:hypothetical protein J3459_018583 [Metarhizium acridum]
MVQRLLSSADFKMDPLVSLYYFAPVCAVMNGVVALLLARPPLWSLTLCGVLKDIMLVVASMIIWGTPVTALQFFGYSIALGGMVYYKLGFEQLKGYMGEASRQWAEFGARKPVLRKIAIIVLAVFIFFSLFTALAPSYSYDPTRLTNTVAGLGKTRSQ